jgi:serine/threonine protein kinase
MEVLTAHNRFGTGYVNDLLALTHPKQVIWDPSGQAWLLDLYDWDLVAVEQHIVALLPFGLNLCVGLSPCKMSIKGNPVGIMRRQKGGFISCLSSAGCENLRMEGIDFSCNPRDSTPHQNSSFKIQGSSLTIINSSFTGCASSEDGGVILSFDRSKVMINSSRFHNSHSNGFGGAISAYGGSLFVVDSNFSDCFASGGGGTIWSAAFQSNYGYSEYYNTVLEIRGSAFANCTAKGDGGAILISSDARPGPRTETLDVQIYSSTFTSCQSSGHGGALRLSGYSVIANLLTKISYCRSAHSGAAISASDGVSIFLNRSHIHDNVALGCGGAISANNSAIVLVDSVLNNNSALGFGGGALFLKATSIVFNRSSCAWNRAPAGGGGLLLSEGSAIPSVEVFASSCNLGNTAMYGPCMASECKSLRLIYNYSDLYTSWAGLPFKFSVAKLDAYHQRIVIDRLFVQILPSTSSLKAQEDLNSSFSFIGSSISQSFQGYVSFEVAIKPRFIEIRPVDGVARVLAQPYIFVESHDLQTGATMKSEILPLKLQEGSSVCPPGYVLDLDYTNLGVCKVCQRETYSVYPLSSDQGSPSCLKCPAGALCSDGSCVFYHSLINRICPDGSRIVGDWEVDNASKRFTLRGCPPGYSVSTNKCDVCPAFFYCTGGKVPFRPCPSDSFTPPGATSLASCIQSVFVIVTLNMPIKRPDFVDDNVVRFRTVLANLTIQRPEFVTIKLVQAGDDPETTTVTVDLALPDAKEAVTVVDRVKSKYVRAGLESSGYYTGASHISVQVTKCILGYELNLASLTCQLCPTSYFCVGGSLGKEACPTARGYSPPGANNATACTSAVFITLTFSLPIFKGNFTDMTESKVIAAISSAAGMSSERVSISTGIMARRDNQQSVLITAKLAAEDAASAAAVKNKINQENLNKQLQAVGIPESNSFSISIPESSAENTGQTLSNGAVIGISVGAVVLFAAVCFGVFYLARQMKRQSEHADCVAAISCAKTGSEASHAHLPPDLRKKYVPLKILGICAHGRGCVVQAKQASTNDFVAIKVLTPLTKIFKEGELDQLRRESRVLSMFSQKNCDYSSRLFLGPGQGVEIYNNVCWYIMEQLKGDSMNTVVCAPIGAIPAEACRGQGGNTVNSVECIHTAQDVLAALKIIHDESILHLNIHPSNIFRCKTAIDSGSREFTYKLIGLGTVQDAADARAKSVVMNTAGTKNIGAGMPSYMSPEMWKDPANALYPADIWSLGITLFVLATGTLPFQPGSSQDWGNAISGNMEEKAPNLLERINAGKSSELDHSLALVVAKALEKKIMMRYSSADEMYGAVFGCLVEHDNASYSVFLSYRAESDAPLALLLFDELNHSKTPGGHRVAVYLNTYGGHVQSDWDTHITKGLLHSICYCPILSYGATAPLASIHGESSAQLIEMGWEKAPLGLDRLCGAEYDREDTLLKEMLIALALLERSSETGFTLMDGERGRLCAAVPIYSGRQQPLGHPDYPRMGDFSQVEGGGGQYSTLPSPNCNQTAARVLRDGAGLPVEAIKKVEKRSVASAVTSLAKLQGCCLWNHADDLAEAVLTRNQKTLVGKGYAGPPVKLDSHVLSSDQVAIFPQP